MSRFQPVVGIDPSGSRLAVAAVRIGLGRPALAAPAVVAQIKGARDGGPPEEAAGILSEYVARHGLFGCPARLCIPARHVFTARAAFPPLRERDLRAALELELERLFPVPAPELRYVWRRAGAARERGISLVVAAARAGYLERWEECVARAGLSLTAAVPAGWALSEALSGIGVPPGDTPTALLRNAGGQAECTIFVGGAPVFCASRACAAESLPGEAIALAGEGYPGIPGAATGDLQVVDVAAPSDWYGQGPIPGGDDSLSWRVDGAVESAARRALLPADDGRDPWELLGAFGAAAADGGMNLLAPPRAEPRVRWAGALAGALGAVTLALAVAWPATVAWKARAELRGLDARIAALQPSVAKVQDELSDIEEIDARAALLREAGAGREEPIEILRVLTERLPTGTWATGLRVENRKIEIDGLSPAASEIFPLLTRDGRFRAVEFASPITRQADSLERFQVRAEFVPPSAGHGGGR